MILDRYQYELDGFLFGLDAPVFTKEDGFNPGAMSWRSQKQDMDYDDARIFGRDYETAPTWSWSLYTDGQNVTEAVDLLTRLRAVWRATGLRRTPGAISTLRYRLEGETRRVYGRPAQFSAPLNNQAMNGVIPITADFDCSDGLSYADDEDSITLGLTIATSDGGFEVPFEAPITVSSSPGERTNTIVVEGSEPTWAVVEFVGPVTRPRLWIDDKEWDIWLDTTVAYDRKVTVDTHPWARTVMNEPKDVEGGGYSVGGQYRGTMMRHVKLEPGAHDLTFTGDDPSATATCTVRWRAARSGL